MSYGLAGVLAHWHHSIWLRRPSVWTKARASSNGRPGAAAQPSFRREVGHDVPEAPLVAARVTRQQRGKKRHALSFRYNGAWAWCPRVGIPATASAEKGGDVATMAVAAQWRDLAGLCCRHRQPRPHAAAPLVPV